MLDLVVSIVNHRNRSLLEPLLASIVAGTRSVRYEIYVVDNASEDGSAEMVSAQFPTVHLVRNPRPQGYAANHNHVLRLAKARYFALLNDDMLVCPGALDGMVAFMDTCPSAGLVGCKLLNVDGTLQRSCWNGYPSARTLLIDLFYLSRIVPGARWVQSFETSLQAVNCAIAVDYVLGACMIVRGDAVDQVGYMDEAYGMFLEETDWCYRMAQAGWQVCWEPRQQMIHYGQRSVGRDPRLNTPLLYRNYCRFSRKHGRSLSQLTVIKAVIIAGALFRAMMWACRSLAKRSGAKDMVLAYLAVPRAVLAS